MKSDKNGLAATLKFLIYRVGVDYYLGDRHSGSRLPTKLLTGTEEPEEADFFLLPEDLNRLQDDLGIAGVARFINSLPLFSRYPERHLFWSSHDNAASPVREAIFCKCSVSAREPGELIPIPYLVEDLAAYHHTEPERFRYDSCFIGYPGSSPLREKMLLAVAADRQLSSCLDIAPKFHSHLPPEIRAARRQKYLDTLSCSLTALCPRGDGMNSIRFFEALSMGRIPVLISDNCLLPFASRISYDRFVIRVAEGEVDDTAGIILDWIREKSTAELMQRCREARQAWEQLLSPASFMGSLLAELTFRNCIARGFESYNSQNLVSAEGWFRAALQTAPQEPRVTGYLALLLNEAGRYGETITLLSAEGGKSGEIPGRNRILGEALQQSGDYLKGVEHFMAALQQEPEDVTLLVNLATSCAALDRYEEAERYLLQGVQLEPESSLLWMNLGGVLQSMQQIDRATEAYRRAVALDRSNGTPLWNLSQILMLQGRFEEGLPLFDARFIKKQPVPLPRIAAPPWRGEPLAGKTVLVCTEQAFGDAIQFARYLPLLAQQGATVLLLNHLKPLDSLLCSVPGVSAVLNDESQLPPVDYYTPLLSLPRLLNTTVNSIPNLPSPYLYPSAERIESWRRWIRPGDAVRIGLCWGGRPEPDPRRSARLADFAPLAVLEGVQLYSLQMGDAAEQIKTEATGLQLIDLTDRISDFEDTAALISLLDLVISVDTSVAHLAGALGGKVFTLLPYIPDWRWMLGRNDSPWYRTMRLFRQQQRGDWGGVVKELVGGLLTGDKSYMYRK